MIFLAELAFKSDRLLVQRAVNAPEWLKQFGNLQKNIYNLRLFRQFRLSALGKDTFPIVKYNSGESFILHPSLSAQS